MISLGELNKLFSNYHLTKYLSKDEFRNLYRHVNDKILGSKNSEMTQEAFIEFFIQFALLVFSRPPIDMSHMPSVELVKYLMKQFEKAARVNGESVEMFQDPDYSGVADKHFLMELNRKVLADPSYPIPEGFHKVAEKDLVIRYELPSYFKVGEEKKIAIELVDELLGNIFGIHVLEPISDTKIIYKVKPTKLKYGQKPPLDEYGYN
jgi:hypothetical protein